MEAELAKAYAQGYVGRNIMGSGFDCDIVIHRGAGAYQAGEEYGADRVAQGKRAQPRIKPPFLAVSGLDNCPTAVNNVETLWQAAADPPGTARNGSRRWDRRRTAARSCSASAATSNGRGPTKRR